MEELHFQLVHNNFFEFLIKNACIFLCINRVIIGHKHIVVACLVAKRDCRLNSAQIIAQMKVAGRLDAGDDTPGILPFDCAYWLVCLRVSIVILLRSIAPVNHARAK